MMTMGAMHWLIVLLMFAAPILLVAMSDRASANSKAVWVLVAVFTSWIGVLAFYLANPRKASEHIE